MAAVAADVSLQSSSGATVSSGSMMVRLAFPIMSHEFFRWVPTASLETTTKAQPAPPPVPAESGDELQLSDLEHVCHLGEGACGVVTKVRNSRTGAVFTLKTTVDTLRRPEQRPERGGRGAPPVRRLVARHALPRRPRRRRHRSAYPKRTPVASRTSISGPANSGGDVKIADFSVSRILHNGRAGERCRRKRIFVAVVSLMYLSPKRFEPDSRTGPRGATAAVDVWGFGVTVLELSLGRCPFLGPSGGTTRPSFEKLRKAICDGEPPSAAAVPELHGFVAACLQKDPRRCATVAQPLAHPFVMWCHIEESRRALRELIVETLKE
ncbi:unnamed protein product [Urochloa decumbens]|uniref:Protein kinase domain-containing protein n=1 Tax=Urochloa decumbens TaxID=240449 RepID=A0ABC8YT93_9POAL